MTYLVKTTQAAASTTATLAALAAMVTLSSGPVAAQSAATDPPPSTKAVDAGRERLTPTAASLANADHVLDLTHTLNADFPFIPIPDITYGFSSRPIATLDTLGANANEWRIHEHLGTQIDAPIHFSRDGRTLEQIRPDELIRPVVIIDYIQPGEANVDAEVTSADIQAWEATNGPIPQGAVVMFNFGWSRHIVGWLKGRRSIATRHEKLAVHFAALVQLAFLRQYLGTPRPSNRTEVRSSTPSLRPARIRFCG